MQQALNTRTHSLGGAGNLDSRRRRLAGAGTPARRAAAPAAEHKA
ncbi:MAG TPA: hypothetical protein VG652_05300 [Gaiellaceae bacterium]|nr:hypothetical protein [Gaiellaceae bacterium]